MSDIQNECQHKFKNCKSAQRIKAIIAVQKQEIDELFNDDYTVLNLLNDFNHIKYSHNINDSVYAFNLLFEFLTNNNDNLTKCDINTCPNILRCYRNRHELNDIGDDYFNYSTELLSRIHSYCLHSLETRILSVDEINYVEQQLNKYKN
eukprot:246025_1